jgi:hypothetical protein
VTVAQRSGLARRLAAALLAVQALLLLVPALQTGRIAEPDEAHYVEGALRMPGAAFDPGSYLHGSLSYDVLALEMVSLYAGARVLGKVGSPEAFAGLYLDHPEYFLVSARLLVLLLFTVALWGLQRVAFLVVRDEWLAFGASAVLQTSPAVLFSFWFVKAEAFALAALVWATFFILLARRDPEGSVSRPPRRRVLLAASAACFGLAVASGYLAVLAAPMLGLLVWPIALDRRDRLACYAGYTAMAFLAFVIAEPYGILHLDRLLKEVSRQREIVAGTDVPTLPMWGKIARDYYAHAIGLPTSAAVVCAVIVAAFRLRRGNDLWSWSLLAYPLLTILYFGPTGGAFYRYFAPTMPFVLLFAGIQADRSTSGAGRARQVLVLLMAGLAAFQAWRSSQFGAYLAQPSTATVVKNWIGTYVPSGSPVVVEGLIVDQVFWCPQIPKVRPALERELSEARLRGASGRLVKLKMERCCSEPAFDVFETPDIESSAVMTPRFVVVCLDDESPFRSPIWNIEPGALARARQERASVRKRWLDARDCSLVHSAEPSVRTGGSLIDAVNFSRLYGGEKGQGLSGPPISVYRCGVSGGP